MYTARGELTHGGPWMATVGFESGIDLGEGR